MIYIKVVLLTCSIIQEFIVLKQKIVIFKFGHFWILINVQNEKTQQNVQNAFFKKPDFTFFKTDSINGLTIVFIKKMKKNIFIFQKTLFGHF
jgi:hypothetical protein